MSFQAMAWACTQRIPATQKIVLLMLANRTNHDTGKCIPKIKTLAEDCGMSESGVKLALKALSDAGLIVVIPRYQDSIQLPNAYHLAMDEGVTSEGGGSPRNPGGVTRKPRVGHDVTTEPVFEPVKEPTNHTTCDSETRRVSTIPDCPHSEVLKLWEKHLPMARQPAEWNEQRMALLRARWRESKPRQDLNWWDRFFAFCAESKFLTGRTQGKDRRPFLLSLDWLLKPSNFLKVIEGAYHTDN